MTKFFRRYSRVLLLVFMCVLMVVFVIGDVIGRGIRSWANPNEQIGEVYGHAVYQSDLRAIDLDAAAAQRFGLPSPFVTAPNDIERSLGLYLLTEEARHVGIVLDADQVRDLLRSRGVPDAAIERQCQRTNRNVSEFYRSLGRIVAAHLLFQLQAEAALSDSLPRLEHAYRDRRQQARVLISVIPAEAFLDDVPEPTEEELQAHFEQAKGRVTEHTAEELRFGYRQPDRIRLEYLTVAPQEILNQVLISEKEARRFFEENQDRYWNALQAEQEQEGPVLPPTYEEVRERVRADFRLLEAIEEARKLVSQMQGDALRPWESLEEGETPPPERIVSFRDLRDRYSQQGEVRYGQTGWVTREGFSRLSGLGTARYTVGQQTFPAADLAFHVKGLVDPNEPNTSADLPLLHVGQPAPLVWTMRPNPTGRFAPYQAYVFRVTQIAPSGPPESLADVRERAVANLRRIKAFERTGQAAQELAERARKVGLKEAVEQDEALRAALSKASADATASAPTASAPTSTAPSRFIQMLGPYEPSKFSRTPTRLLNIGQAPHLHERVFELAEANPQPQTPAVLVVPLPEVQRWAVVQFLGLQPLYEGEFQNQRQALEQQLANTRTQFVLDWHDLKNILLRTNYVSKQPLPAEQEPDEGDSAAQ